MRRTEAATITAATEALRRQGAAYRRTGRKIQATTAAIQATTGRITRQAAGRR